MNLYRATLFFIFIVPFIAKGQDKMSSCHCPKKYENKKTDTTIYLTNGKVIMVCGDKNSEMTPATFTEFALYVCGQDTMINYDSWTEEGCTIKTNMDTLLLEDVINLPTGKNFTIQPTLWTTDKIYFKKDKINRNLVINNQIAKYNKNEITTVLKEYETSKSGYSDYTMNIISKLFMASISGSKKARKYFKACESRFSLDGAYLEEYDDLTAKLSLWYEKK